MSIFIVIGWLVVGILPLWCTGMSWFCFKGFDSSDAKAGFIFGIIALMMWAAWIYSAPFTITTQ